MREQAAILKDLRLPYRKQPLLSGKRRTFRRAIFVYCKHYRLVRRAASMVGKSTGTIGTEIKINPETFEWGK
jgi:hypothetical protein